MKHIIEFSNVVKRFGDQTVLNDISFGVNPGETIVLMGASGCGKSTLLRCINGLETIDSGQIIVRDTTISTSTTDINWNHHRASIGMVFQQFNLFPHLTVLGNIMLGPVNVKKIPPKHAKDDAMAHLERMGLAHKANQYPQLLSGGEKQRVAIARALCMSSDIVLMDEPTSALDPLMTGEVLRTIEALANEGITLMIVTHEVAFAKLVADRILFFDQGQILVDAPPAAYDNLHDQPIAKRYFDQLSLQCA